jgi:urease accessory protein
MNTIVNDRRNLWLVGMALVMSLLPTLAFAHTGHHPMDGFGHGFTHPMLGVDHLLVMLIVGVWAAQQTDRFATWMPIGGFIGMMLVGFLGARSGIHLPFIESGIPISVLMMGLLVATGLRCSIRSTLPLIGLFAFFHGHAHGMEIPVGVNSMAYMTGFLFGTGLLHAIGLLAGVAIRAGNHSLIFRFCGGMVAVAGFLFLLW